MKCAHHSGLGLQRGGGILVRGGGGGGAAQVNDAGKDLAGTCSHRRALRIGLEGCVQEAECPNTLSGSLAEPKN